MDKSGRKNSLINPLIWINSNENKGLCPFCLVNAEAELKKRRQERRERERLIQMSEEQRKKNTLEGWIK